MEIIALTEEMKREFESYETVRHIMNQPPKESYFYFPPESEKITYDVKNPLKTTRFFFEGGVEFIEFEKEKLNGLEEEIKKLNKTKGLEPLIFPEDWKESDTLRFLQSSGYDYPRTIQVLKNHFEFKKVNFPLKITNKIMELLNIGFIYGHGRDKQFRPLVFINAKVYIEHRKSYSTNDWVMTTIVFMDYMIKHLLLPGQVESWNTICDVEGVSLLLLPPDFKNIIDILQCNYRARLKTMYILNVNFLVMLAWKVVKAFLDPNTEKKIKIIRNNIDELFERINKNQVEEKFGGNAKNVTEYYFPHIIPNQDFFLNDNDKNSLVTEDQYREIIDKNNKYIKSPFLNWNNVEFQFDDDEIMTNQVNNIESKSSNSVNHAKDKLLHSYNGIFTIDEEIGHSKDKYKNAKSLSLRKMPTINIKKNSK